MKVVFALPPWLELEEYLNRLADTLPKAKLVKAIHILSQGRRDRFARVREPVYGNVWLGFEEHELSRFLAVLPYKYRILFMCQLALLLRVGEVARLKQENFTKDYLSVYVQLQKGGGAQRKPVPYFLAQEIKEYARKHQKQINESGGYLFFSDDRFREGKTQYPHLSPHYILNKLRRMVKKAGMDEVYGISSNGKKLHRLNTHSFKRTGATLLNEQTGNLALTQSLTGHKSLDVLSKHYVRPSEKSKRSAINTLFRKL